MCTFDGNIANGVAEIRENKEEICDLCSYASSDAEDLKRHIQSEHLKIEENKCDICTYAARFDKRLQRHIKYVRTQINDKKCTARSEKSKLAILLKAAHCKVKDQKWSMCPYMSSISRLREQNRDEKCCQCDYATSNKSILHRHMETVHHQIRVSAPYYDLDPLKIETTINSDDEDNTESKRQKERGNETRNKCSHCKKVFKHPSALKRHVVTHTGEKKFHCDRCPMTFGNNNHLIRHYRAVHKVEPPMPPQKSFPCPSCDQTFAQMCKLKLHNVFHHTKEKPFQCNLCSENFYNNSHLQRHYMAHMKEKPFGCSRCDRRFLQQSNLAAHEGIHSGEKSYSCHICEKSFRATNTLRDHVMIHSDKKRHTCTECGAEFIRKTTLQRHMMSHTKERPFGCEHCHKKFATKSHVRRHSSTVHKEKVVQFVSVN